MNKIIDYFITNKSDKKEDILVKERLVVFFSLFTIMLSLFMIPTYLYLNFTILLNLLFVLLVGNIAILFHFKYRANLRFTSFLFITFCLIFLSLNIIYTGAITSVLVVWLIILPILAILLNNGLILYSIVSGLLIIGLLAIFEHFNIHFPNEMGNYAGTYVNLLSRVNFMGSIILIIYLYDKKREEDKELLKKSNTDLEQFAYIASHDMKAPLRNIMSFAQLLQRKSKGEADPDIKKYIEHILNNGYQMNELIQGILSISKINAQDNLEFKAVNLNIALDKVKLRLEKELEIKNALLNYEKLPTIQANEAQIIQVFQNLIENGIKYNRRKQPIINISYQQEKKLINLYFSDNGIGISPQYHDRIFEMFKRLHSGFEFKGTGIGLAICKKIALQHKGDLVVEKSSDEGTVFKLTLPIK